VYRLAGQLRLGLVPRVECVLASVCRAPLDVLECREIERIDREVLVERESGVDSGFVVLGQITTRLRAYARSTR